MNTIFRNLYNFSREYPHYGLEVSIKSISEDGDADQFYEKITATPGGLTQVIQNPR